MEIGMLVEGRRLKFTVPLSDWLTRAVAPPLVESVRISPQVVEEIIRIPLTAFRDPADRILVATARIHGAKLLTHDERIRESGLVDCV